MSFPSVLLIGDSITQTYAPAVVEALREIAHVELIPDNGGDSANVLAHVADWLGDGAWDVVHFNCGLHDLRFDPERDTYQAALEEYEANVREVVAWLQRETSTRLVWATITPVVEEWHNAGKGFCRFNRDVEAYNAAALRVVRAAGVEVDDLHAFVVERGVRETVCPDGVHMTEDGSRALGHEVARFLEPIVRALA